jgi:ADP-heptose:LPS heptosyltransferase
MPQFAVDEDLAALVERLAKPRPFENLSFNAALRRVLQEYINPKKVDDDLEQLLAEAMAAAKKEPKKVPSPSPQQWAASVPELRNKKGLSTWQAVCELLKIETAGDSARRRLKNWVKANRPKWPSVPGIHGD